MAEITDLPKTILQKIFSLMRVEEAIKASMTCKTLSGALTRSDLVFNLDDHLNVDHLTALCSSRDLQQHSMGIFYEAGKKYRRLLDYADRTMERYHNDKIPIQSFKLRWFGFQFREEWIETAVQNGAETLDLCCTCSLPTSVLESENLLELIGTRFYLPEQEIRCRRLKRLRLEDVLVNVSTFGKLMSSCKEMERLEILSCKFAMEGIFHYFKVFLYPCQNLEYLHLSDVDIGNTSYFEYLDDKCPNLKKLILCNPKAAAPSTRITISSSSLEALQLKLKDGHEEVWVYCPQMKQFGYHGNHASRIHVVAASSDCSSEIAESQNSDGFYSYKWKGLISNLPSCKFYL